MWDSLRYDIKSKCFIPSRTFWVTVKVFPVSNGTVQLTGSGERIKICSGDFTRVGSGGDFIICSTSGCGNGLGPVCEWCDSSSASIKNNSLISQAL